jgi:mannitol/fructose-specific phosphotransferase system IIA component (Ntr-type)
MSVDEVAASLYLDAKAVERLAKAGELPCRLVGGRWQFRAGEVANWAANRLPAIAAERRRPPRLVTKDLLVSAALFPEAVGIPLDAKTRGSVLFELVRLAERTGRLADGRDLMTALLARERQCSTALPVGVAIPHACRVGQDAGGPAVLAAGRVDHGIPFGDRAGGLTDVFFLLCCEDYRAHLVYLGRLCRLLSEPEVLAGLRSAADAPEFVSVLRRQEEAFCQTSSPPTPHRVHAQGFSG